MSKAKLIDLLGEALDAFQNEEPTVRLEHKKLIKKMERVLAVEVFKLNMKLNPPRNSS